MNIESVNRQAWNQATAERCPWVRPVSGETINPYNFLFGDNEGVGDEGLTATYSLPFVEEEALSEDEVRQAIARNMMFCRSHTLEAIIGGQARAGFAITDLIESRRTDARAPGINRLCPTYFATLAVKV